MTMSTTMSMMTKIISRTASLMGLTSIQKSTSSLLMIPNTGTATVVKITCLRTVSSKNLRTSLLTHSTRMTTSSITDMVCQLVSSSALSNLTPIISTRFSKSQCTTSMSISLSTRTASRLTPSIKTITILTTAITCLDKRRCAPLSLTPNTSTR